MKIKSIARLFRNYFTSALIPILLAIALGTGASTARAVVYTLSVPISAPWYDTGIDIVSGSQLNITAAGIVHYGPFSQQLANANGGDFDGTLFYSTTVYPSTIALSLIGKIGGTVDLDTGTPLVEGTTGNGAGFVGVSYDKPVFNSGRLFLGYNDQIGFYGDNSGSFDVTVSVLPIPEPASATLLLIGAALAAWKRGCRRKSAV